MSAKIHPASAPTTPSSASAMKKAPYPLAACHAARRPAAIQVTAGTMAHSSATASAHRRN